MNLYQIVNIFGSVCKEHRFVEEFQQGDIYEILNSGTHRYGLACLTIGDLSIDGDLVTMNGTLFWADRLTDDKANMLEARSNGVSILKNVVLNIEENCQGVNFRSQTYSVFTEQFADLCAGAFVQFSLTYPIESACANDAFVQKTLTITENGLYDVIGYSQVVVSVGAEWGGITGDITQQTDLMNRLNAKANKSDLNKLKPLIYAGL